MKCSSNNTIIMGPRFGFFMTIALLLPWSTVGQSCIDDFEQIYKREALITDTSVPRIYYVCPKHIYDMGNLDFDGNLIQPNVGTVAPPLPLRPNMTIRCGDQGDRENLCWLRGGDLHMDGTKVLGIEDDTLENVNIEGFVFIGAREHSLLANKPGSITFRDCEFRDFTNSSVPIMLDYYNASNPSEELVTTFFDCDFRDNRYFGMGSQSALIYGNSVQNRIKIERVVFENNDMIWNNTRPDTHSYIVESLGPVNIQNTCFKDNLVGSSDVVVFGNKFENDQNFVSNSSGVLCPFSSVFETIEQFDSFKPTCIEATSTACQRFVTSSPTASPSSGPTASPAPSSTPTATPTISPRPTISPMPTEQPSVAPSGKPSQYGDTKSPSEAPSKFQLDFFWPTFTTEVPTASAVSPRSNTILVFLFSACLYCLFL